MTQVTEKPLNVAALLIDSLIASNRGDRNAFSFAEKRYSYQDVAALMNRAGNMIKALGVGRDAAVLVLLPGSPAFVASLLGAMKAGAMPVLGLSPGDAHALQACVAACKPSLVVIHQNDLATASGSLVGVAADAIVVVGGEGKDHRSFVDEIRGQSSWLSAEAVNGNAAALAVWAGSAMQKISHAELFALVGPGDPGKSRGATLPTQAVAAIAMLRTFATGETATLP
jgi:acyl-coenzyme A synthetase/AMP-(fatty) acid ligase